MSKCYFFLKKGSGGGLQSPLVILVNVKLRMDE